MTTNKINLDTQKLNVLLIGSGVIGSVYGGQFSLAGHSLWALAHGTHEQELAQSGIRLRDVAAPKVEVARVVVARRADEREYDLVLVAVRSDQLASTFPALRTLKGRPHILFLGNNPDGHKAIPSDLPGTVQLGFPGIGGGLRDEVVEYVHVTQQPTMLELINPDIAHQIDIVLASRYFPLQHTTNMDGWLAYHAVFITCISMALLRVGGDTAKLGNDRALLKLMCRAIEEGFRMLRSQGTRGAPRSLTLLHTPILRSIAMHYWGSLMRSPKGELYFAAHTRHASDEVYALAKWVLSRIKANSPAVDHLRNLLGQPPKLF